MEGKRLGLLRELVPTVTRIAVLLNPTYTAPEAQLKEVEEAARTLGLQTQILHASTELDLDTAFATLAHLRVGALQVCADPFFNSQRDHIVALAAHYAIPAIYEQREFAVVGGLASYGTSLTDAYHQIGLYTGVRDIDVGQLKHNVVGLAKAAKLLNVPVIVTATSPEMWGPVIPELTEALPGISIINRTTVNAFDEPRFAKAVEATGRKKLIIAGISLEVCAAFPAITAVGKGLDAYVAVDASGTFSETKRQAGLLRMLQAGIIVSDYATLMVEMLKDNARPEAGEVYEAIDMAWAKLVGQMSHGK
jgi:nicotinamidase-related amidase